MKTVKIIIGAVLLLLGTVAVGSAKTEYQFQTGECENGNTWWSVTEWNGGRLIGIWGKDCDGKNYYKPAPSYTVLVADDPTQGLSPVFGGSCEPGISWKAVLTYNSSKRVVSAGGQLCDGTYWRGAFDWSTGDGWEDAPPVPGIE